MARKLLKTRVLDNPYIPHKPSPKQAVFLCAPQSEVFYGGAGGGGKSDALLMGALMYCDEPGYSAIIFRRTFKDLSLPDGLIPRSHEWLTGTDAKWNDDMHEWNFPSGAKIVFGYMDNENAHFRYQSSAYQYIAFDEVTEFSEHQYRFMFSRRRKLEGSVIPLRTRCSSNPIGKGKAWVHRRFILEKEPTRLFIPARLEDNPFLDQEAYDESLRQLDPVTRAQIRYGNWDIRPEGGMFKREWLKPVQVDELPKDRFGNSELMDVVRRWDLAATEPGIGDDPDYTVGVKMARTTDGEYYILDVIRDRLTPLGVERLVRAVADSDGIYCEVHIEQEPGASGKYTVDHFMRNVLPEFPVYGQRVTGNKIERAKPFSAACEQGRMNYLFAAWNGEFIDELESFPEGIHDDQVDAASGAYSVLAGRMAEIGLGPKLWV